MKWTILLVVVLAAQLSEGASMEPVEICDSSDSVEMAWTMPKGHPIVTVLDSKQREMFSWTKGCRMDVTHKDPTRYRKRIRNMACQNATRGVAFLLTNVTKDDAGNITCLDSFKKIIKRCGLRFIVKETVDLSKKCKYIRDKRQLLCKGYRLEDGQTLQVLDEKNRIMSGVSDSAMNLSLSRKQPTQVRVQISGHRPCFVPFKLHFQPGELADMYLIETASSSSPPSPTKPETQQEDNADNGSSPTSLGVGYEIFVIVAVSVILVFIVVVIVVIAVYVRKRNNRPSKSEYRDVAKGQTELQELPSEIPATSGRESQSQC